MKLASLPQLRDGRLIIVSDDLAWYADADHIVPTMQGLLDDWDAMMARVRNEEGAAEQVPMGELVQELLGVRAGALTMLLHFALALFFVFFGLGLFVAMPIFSGSFPPS